MLRGFPIELQVYVVSLAFGLIVPLTVLWMLYAPLRQFLSAIFRNPEIEKFWMRLVLLVFLGLPLSVTLGYHPAASVAKNYVALIWNLADQCQAILQSLLWAVFSLFVPLLLAYTIVHAGRGSREKSNSVNKEP